MLTEPPLRVLIVDDEPDIISVLKEGLKLRGFDVDGFTVPRKALEQFKPNSYDIVASDIKMPHINGFQLCRKIKAKEARVRVYLLSAFDIRKRSRNDIPYARLDGFHQEADSISRAGGNIEPEVMKVKTTIGIPAGCHPSTCMLYLIHQSA